MSLKYDIQNRHFFQHTMVVRESKKNPRTATAINNTLIHSFGSVCSRAPGRMSGVNCVHARYVWRLIFFWRLSVAWVKTMFFAVKASFSHSSHSVLCRRCAVFVVDLQFILQEQFLRNKCVYTSYFPSAQQLSRGLDYITKSAFTGKLESDLPLRFNCTLFYKSFELPTTSF